MKVNRPGSAKKESSPAGCRRAEDACWNRDPWNIDAYPSGRGSREAPLTGKTVSSASIQTHGPQLTIVNCLESDHENQMHSDIRDGLSRKQKSIPCKYLYDAYGSRLFDEICHQPEYYPTRTELMILDAYAPRIMSFFSRDGGDLVEIGSGSDLKVRRFFSSLPSSRFDHVRYVPVDISETGMMHSARNLLATFRSLKIHGIIGDFTCHLDRLPKGRKLITFFGGTFGNFPHDKAGELLEAFASVMGTDDRLLIGIDMLKSPDIIEAAYNDRAGITARFNLNILNHINFRLEGDFDTDDFEHVAFFDHDKNQVEMHLRARKRVSAFLAGIPLHVGLENGETIHTEISRKFDRAYAEMLFRDAGFLITDWYTDPGEWFCLAELKRADEADPRHYLFPA